VFLYIYIEEIKVFLSVQNHHGNQKIKRHDENLKAFNIVDTNIKPASNAKFFTDYDCIGSFKEIDVFTY
jgi:hypothetical protein